MSNFAFKISIVSRQRRCEDDLLLKIEGKQNLQGSQWKKIQQVASLSNFLNYLLKVNGHWIWDRTGKKDVHNWQKFQYGIWKSVLSLLWQYISKKTLLSIGRYSPVDTPCKVSSKSDLIRESPFNFRGRGSVGSKIESTLPGNVESSWNFAMRVGW